MRSCTKTFQNFYVKLSRCIKNSRHTICSQTTKLSKPFETSDNNPKMPIKILNVAEKNDAAKNIADLLSRGSSRRVNQNANATVTLFLLRNLYFFLRERACQSSTKSTNFLILSTEFRRTWSWRPSQVISWISSLKKSIVNGGRALRYNYLICQSRKNAKIKAWWTSK